MAIFAVATGCNTATGAASSPTSAPSASSTATTLAAGNPCATYRWPARIPAVIGEPFGTATAGSLACFHVTAEVPGTDVAVASDSPWKIVMVRPAVGTRVTAKTSITVYLRMPVVRQTRRSEPAPVHHVPAAPAPVNPGGPTAECRDGTYSYSRHHQGTCSHHHGVAIWFN